jgi:hypothetical protein
MSSANWLLLCFSGITCGMMSALNSHFNLKSFWAAEAALLTVMLAYNLMNLSRQGVLRTESVSDKKAV